MSHPSPVTNTRKADFPIDAQFTERWSPRAYTGEVISEADVMSMLEAARWAPSSNNAQPWRFAVVMRNDPQWDALFATLNPNNQAWVGKAGAFGYQDNHPWLKLTEGSSSNVVGLPMELLAEMLQEIS